ncbi:MAG TPA: 4'-phosphopantetheinyl transferase superfamily protein [Burkholderiales bacterium]|nr:4'-phosphopantetheinyl transferase superfamily protein [Burkholderiales bacterium]
MPVGGTEVWIVPLDPDTGAIGRCMTLLSGDELERAGRFHFECDRRHFTIARGTLRMLLGARLAVDPKAVRFGRTEKGKLFVIGATLHFNVSHSHERALIVISDSRPVGVDIEYLHREIDHAALAARFLTSKEQACYAATPADLRARFFLECWTRKEAVAKASGEGLGYGFAKLDTLPPEDTAADRSRDTMLERAGWLIRGLPTDNDYVAALALRAET